MNKMLAAVVAFSSLVAATGASAAPWVAEEAQVPMANGMAAIAMVRDGHAMRTVVCRDTSDAFIKIRPDGIAYDTSDRHGKIVRTEEVIDTAKILPVNVDACTVSAGNHFDAAVRAARTA
ncbi:hypothetical protein [uncultured Sphingomonas sp.]|uniref:hypothetical protein n=1 Tax=uncultured Sphingomonas sp. TaxID=158754 RepID=UPI0026005EA5|nr:hypothetical protein [uncultured Sphingomonas sp.]